MYALHRALKGNGANIPQLRCGRLAAMQEGVPESVFFSSLPQARTAGLQSKCANCETLPPAIVFQLFL